MCDVLCSATNVLSEYMRITKVCFSQVISKSSEVIGDSAIEEKYLIATSEQPLCALHRYCMVHTCTCTCKIKWQLLVKNTYMYNL